MARAVHAPHRARTPPVGRCSPSPPSTAARRSRCRPTPTTGGFSSADLGSRRAPAPRGERATSTRSTRARWRSSTASRRTSACPEIRVVSGYRVPKPGSRSNHGKGRAVDMVVPGVPDEEVARFAREIGLRRRRRLPDQPVRARRHPSAQLLLGRLQRPAHEEPRARHPGRPRGEERRRRRGARAARRSSRSAWLTDVDAALRARGVAGASAQPRRRRGRRELERSSWRAGRRRRAVSATRSSCRRSSGESGPAPCAWRRSS